jgi:hypothetical protein
MQHAKAENVVSLWKTCAICAFLLNRPWTLRTGVTSAAEPGSSARWVDLAADFRPDPNVAPNRPNYSSSDGDSNANSNNNVDISIDINSSSNGSDKKQQQHTRNGVGWVPLGRLCSIFCIKILFGASVCDPTLALFLLQVHVKWRKQMMLSKSWSVGKW